LIYLFYFIKYYKTPHPPRSFLHAQHLKMSALVATTSGASMWSVQPYTPDIEMLTARFGALLAFTNNPDFREYMGAYIISSGVNKELVWNEYFVPKLLELAIALAKTIEYTPEIIADEQRRMRDCLLRLFRCPADMGLDRAYVYRLWEEFVKIMTSLDL
jgi:hypothetical protein